MIRATFIMEQHIGHRSFYENLRSFVSQSPQISATWVEITYDNPGSIWQRLPKIPQKLRGTLVGREQVKKAMLERKADIVLFNTQVPAVLAGSALHHIPYLVCTDITPIQYDRMGRYYNHQEDKNGFISQYKYWRNREVFKGAQRVLPWSTWNRLSLEKDYGVSPRDIEVIPPGVDIKRWSPGSRFGEKPVKILFVGGDLYRKGGQTLLEAFRVLPKGLAELILVTRSAVAAETGIIVYNDMKPNSPELINLYRSCDIFVLPTFAEAFGIAAIEACAVGLPVIATRVGGLPDIVKEGQTGFLIEPKDSADLSEKIKLLVEDLVLRERFGAAARVHAENCFDAQKNSNRVIQLLLETAKAGKKHEPYSH
jgi:glycosyltransferase involved in cell wall biosynthesis